MTDSNVFFLNAHEAMLRAGVDTAEVYRRIGIDPDELLKPGVRIPHRGQMSFWAAVEAVTGDAEIGLHLCPYVSPFAGEIVNHLFVSSPTLRDGLQNVFKYFRLLSDHLDIRLVTDAPGPYAMLSATIGDHSTPRHTEVTLCYGVLQAIRLATAGKFQAARLELNGTPAADLAGYPRIFGCPVEFGAPRTQVHFDRSVLDLPFLHANPEAASAHEAVAHRQMRRLGRRDTVDAVRKLLASELSSGLCTPAWVAAQLKRSPRGLRSELLDAGTSFNQLFEEVRQSSAKQLLARTEESIERIAQLAGFSDSSAFFRAFKKWTGSTPTQYRKSKQAHTHGLQPD